MVYRNFIVNIVLRILLATAVISVFSWFLLVRPDYIKAAFALLLLVSIVVELIRYVNRSNRDFRDFIHLLKSNDFTTRFSGKRKGRSFEKLYAELNALGEKYRQLNLEKELKHRHLQTVLSHVDIGIISFSGSGQIQLVNQAFRELFEVPYLAENQTISYLDSTFVAEIKTLKPGSNKLFEMRVGSRDLKLALQVSIYKLKEEEFKLVSAKNIISELEQKELESYQKLIRVLTHEIMNSITPISSLSNTLHTLLQENKLHGNDELAGQVKTGIEAIHDRSSNLLQFTESYRKLTRLPRPEIEAVSLKELLTHTQTIAQSIPGGEHIRFTSEVQPGLMLQADPKMIEQVLVNVYKNAIEALAGIPSAAMNTTASLTRNERVQLEISDNGPGMKDEVAEKIFIPFYTTKTEGSGIGLSLCRQIVLAHHGMIKVESEAGKGTRVVIVI